MKLNIMLHALTSGIMYKVRTVECGNQQFSVWRVWNIPQGISRYGISNNDRTPQTFYYQRSSNPAAKLARTLLTCKSCEA